MSDSAFPFIIIRCYGTGEENRNFITSTFAAQRQYPGLVNEIWFSGNVLEAWQQNELLARQSLPFRNECRQLGIDFSYQHGITLNHSGDGKHHADIFSPEAWAVDIDGERAWGMFCANSPEARQYTLETAEKFLALLQPDSYWPDDDLRLYRKGGKNYCFCDRCIAKFNRRFGGSFTRQELKEALFGDMPDAGVRRQWMKFNGETLGEFAALFRAAVAKVLPRCRLGIQTVYSDWRYDGDDFRPMIEALAGAEKAPVGVRPGACYYDERTPREMLMKSLCAGEEAARCKAYNNGGQICYEAENWPHISARKSPEAQMIECALMLARGMDSLALYWGSDKNDEGEANYRFYFDTLAQYKAYFLAIREACKNSHLAGGTFFHGGNFAAGKNWCSVADEDELFWMSNGVPIVRESSECEFFMLNQRAVKELAGADLPKLFANTVLMDMEAFEALKAGFPGLKFPEKVELEALSASSKAAGADELYECFERKFQALDFSKLIHPKSGDVKSFSTFTNNSDAAGICTIPTEYGGNVVLIQYMNRFMLNGFRRKAILDALDSVIPGGMAVRLLTNGFAVNVIARKSDRSGKTAGAFLLNLSIGATPELEVAIRNPEYQEYELILPRRPPVKLVPYTAGENELCFRIPALSGWQSALIAGSSRMSK